MVVASAAVSGHCGPSGRRPPLGARLLGLLAMAVLIVGACRPPIAEDNGGDTATAEPTEVAGPVSLAPGETAPPPTDTPAPDTPEPSFEPADTALPAQALQPKNQVSVEVRLFHGFAPDIAPLQYAQALDHYRAVNLVVDIAPPIAGYDPFAVDPAPDVIPVWIGTVADVGPAAAAGVTLKAVGELTGRDATVLVVPARSAIKGPSDLKGEVLADSQAAASSAVAAGAPTTVHFALPDDASAPFDPTSLVDGTDKAAVVSVFDGWPRVLEAGVAAGLSETAFKAIPLRPQAEAILGELVWVQATDLGDPDLNAAVAAFLGTIGQAEVDCRDAVDDCAGVAGAQSDRSPDGIAWSIDQLDRLLFPSVDGILHIDPGEWTRTVSAMHQAGVAGIDGLTYTNDIVDAVLKALSSLDIHGTGWKPENRTLFP